MARRLVVTAETWPIQGAFKIARGAKTQAHVIVAAIHDGQTIGRGECVPYARYGESVQSVLEEIRALRIQVENGLTREALQHSLPPGAARNALDCALVDLEAKTSGRPAFELLGLAKPVPVRTAFTLSLDTPAAMGQAAASAATKGFFL